MFVQSRVRGLVRVNAIARVRKVQLKLVISIVSLEHYQNGADFCCVSAILPRWPVSRNPKRSNANSPLGEHFCSTLYRSRRVKNTSVRAFSLCRVMERSVVYHVVKVNPTYREPTPPSRSLFASHVRIPRWGRLVLTMEGSVSARTSTFEY